MKVSSQIYFY